MTETISQLSDRDLELAALENLSPLPFVSQWFPKPESDLLAVDKWVETKQAWVDQQPDKRIRKAYNGWLEYVRGRVRENREENRTHAERRAYEARQKARDDEWSRGREASKKIPHPLK